MFGQVDEQAVDRRHDGTISPSRLQLDVAGELPLDPAIQTDGLLAFWQTADGVEEHPSRGQSRLCHEYPPAAALGRPLGLRGFMSAPTNTSQIHSSASFNLRHPHRPADCI